jgi:hypothetical protein
MARSGSISRRQIVRGAAATAAAMTLGAPSVRAQKGQQTLRFVAEADLRVLDPIWNTAYITAVENRPQRQQRHRNLAGGSSSCNAGTLRRHLRQHSTQISP